MYALHTASGAAACSKVAVAERPFVDLDRQALGCVVRGIASGLRDVLPVPEREPLPAKFEPLIQRLMSGPLNGLKVPSSRRAA